MRRGYVVAIGSLAIDENIFVEAYPVLGDKVLAKYGEKQVGGMIPNFTCNLASAGIETHLITQFADDEYLDVFKNELREYNVQYESSRVRKNCKSTKCVVLNNNVDKSVLIVLGDMPRYSLSGAQLNLIENSSYLYSSISELRQIMNYDEILELSRKSTDLVLDIEPETFTSLKEDVDFFDSAKILIFNEFGYKKIIDEDSSVIERLVYSGKIIVLTKGKHGVSLITKGYSVNLEGKNVKSIDTTGAGDMFNAMFIASIINGSSYSDSLEYANEMAALHTTIIGPKVPKEGFK